MSVLFLKFTIIYNFPRISFLKLDRFMITHNNKVFLYLSQYFQRKKTEHHFLDLQHARSWRGLSFLDFSYFKIFSQTLSNRQIGRLLKSQFHNTALVFVFIEEDRVEHIMSKADGIFWYNQFFKRNFFFKTWN